MDLRRNPSSGHTPLPDAYCQVGGTNRYRTYGLVGVECPNRRYRFLSALYERLYGLRRLQQFALEVFRLVSP